MGSSIAGIAPAVLLLACTSNVVLRRAPATDTGTLGPMQRCDAPEKPCVVDPQQDTSLFNAAHTTYLTLPNCPYGIEQILIQNSGSSNVDALVECASRSEPTEGGKIPITTKGGGTAPAP